MDVFMGSMSANQALEWEFFAKDNPSFEDALLLQIAHIACLFASATMKRQDGGSFEVSDFIPWKKKSINNQKKGGNNLISAFKELALRKGDAKAKEWATAGQQDRPKVKGTDGKMYTYSLEEFATRTKPPRRFLNGLKG